MNQLHKNGFGGCLADDMGLGKTLKTLTLLLKLKREKTYKATIQLQASHRLVLTGTPIENTLSDLWAQMNFLNPGLLGSHNWFQKTFITTIKKQNDTEQQKMLQTLISLFILRRKKEEVARELPPLTEHVVF